MVNRLVLLLILPIVPCYAVADEVARPETNLNKTVEQRLRSIEDRIGGLEQRFEVAWDKLNSIILPENNIAAMSAKQHQHAIVRTAAMQSKEGNDRVAALQLQVDALLERMGSITYQPQNDAPTILNLLGKMGNDSNFRQEFAHSVQGRLLVQNYTEEVQTIYVNDNQGREVAKKDSSGELQEIWVPFGYVRTQLGGNPSLGPPERAKTWNSEDWDFIGGVPTLRIAIRP